MKTRLGDLNAGLQEAPTEASAVYYEHPFPSLYSLLSCIYSPYFVYSGSDQICLFTVSIKYLVRPAGRSVHRYSYMAQDGPPDLRHTHSAYNQKQLQIQ